MKKLISIFILSLLFIGCSSDDNDDTPPVKIDIKESSINLAYGTTNVLTLTGIDKEKCEWVSGDDFIATVFDGEVSAKHIGETKIYAIYQNSKDSCIVKVTSINDYIYIPVIDWNLSKGG
ncbi:MAG: hypothetical protein ACK5LF_21380 [Bacteroides xylanisolvens]